MRHPIYTISNHTLRTDIKAHRKLLNSTFTMTSYRLQEHLEHQSERILQSFAEEYLTLEKNQYKLFAKYINIFARSEKEECFKRLQGLADFDIKAYLEDQNKSVWEKIFGKKEKSPKAKTSRQMKREMRRYVKACRKGDEFKAHDIREGAEMYVASFLRDEFALQEKDEKIFKDYIRTILYPVYAGENGDKAINKIRSGNYRKLEAKEKISMPKISMPKISMPKISMPKISMPKISMPKISMPKISMPKISMPKISMPKISMPKISMPSFSLASNEKRTILRVSKVLGFTTLLAAGTIWGAKNCAGSDKDTFAQNKTEQAQTPQKDLTAKTDSSTFHFEPVSNLSFMEFKQEVKASEIKSDIKETHQEKKVVAQNNVKQTQTKKTDKVTKSTSRAEASTTNAKASKQAAKTTEVKSEVKETKTVKMAQSKVIEARINHHRFILKKRIGSKRMQAMYAKINMQMSQGVFSLPNDLGTDDFAYALVMYRAHGVDCSLDEALNATSKLSAEANAQIINDILEAGDTGLGVKAKAEKIHLAENKGPLEEGYSLYNQLSEKDQHQHNVNLKQYRQAKKMLAASLAR